MFDKPTLSFFLRFFFDFYACGQLRLLLPELWGKSPPRSLPPRIVCPFDCPFGCPFGSPLVRLLCHSSAALVSNRPAGYRE